MKTILSTLILSFSLFIFACSGEKADSKNPENAKTENSDQEKKETTQQAPTTPLKKDARKIGPEKSAEQIAIEKNIAKISQQNSALCGYWVGVFGNNKINIALAEVTDSLASGHSVCAGNYREIKGKVKKINDKLFEFEMSEPGDDQYDGKFKFRIDLERNKLSGNWTPFKNTVKPKAYTLDKKEFKYDPTIGDFAEASTRYYEESELSNLLPEEAEMIRNAIYARHGYSFDNIKIRRIYDVKDWYIPVSTDVRDYLTEIEVRNIDLLYQYENYQEEYYDDFGR